MLLNDTQRQILRSLARLRVAIMDQLLYWSDVQAASSIRRALNPLCAHGFVSVLTDLHPRAYQLTGYGARVIGGGATRRRSFSVTSNLCHRNSAEIALHREHGAVRALPRESVYRLGLVPSHAEHAFMLGDTLALVLIDDYYMQSGRIDVSWSRLHQRPNPAYYSVLDHGLRAWSSVAQALYVFTTDPEQYARHEAFCDEHAALPVQVRELESIWGIAC